MSNIPDNKNPSTEGIQHVNSLITVHGMENEDLLFLGSVLVINCGGTINMGTAPVKGPAGVVEAKLANIQRDMARFGVSVKSEPIFDRPPDSSNIGEREWRVIIGKLVEILDKKAMLAMRLRAQGIHIEAGGIVIAHGTDTLQVTALIVALEFSVRALTVPIVFTASHSPIGDAGSDGLSNLRKAIFIAKERFSATAHNLPPAVYVLIGQDVHLAARLTKVRTMPDSDGRYFFSFPAPVGRITGDRFHLRIDEAYLHKMLPEAPVHGLSLNRPRRFFGIVEHLYVDKFASAIGLQDVKRRADFYRAEVPLDQRGLSFVVQGDFSANPEFLEIAKVFEGISNGAPVFVGSKRSFERIGSLVEGRNCFLLPKSMTHAKAQAKLRWLLSFPGIESEIDKYLNCNFAGEVLDSDSGELPEWINYETFPDRKEGTEVVIVYPDLHWKVVGDAVDRLRNSKHRNPRLFLFGFGDGHVPAVNIPLREIVCRHVEHEILGRIPFGEEEVAVEDVVDGVARHLAKCPTIQLKDYLALKYSIESKSLKSALMREVAQEMRSREIERLKNSISALIARKRGRGPMKLSIKNKEGTIDSIVRNVRVVVPNDELVRAVKDVEIEDWSYNLVETLKTRFARVLARRMIKDAIMTVNRLLEVIGAAVDLNIDVKIRSLAVKSRTNTTNYEQGNLLRAIGVNSEEIEGWNTQYFQPRR